MRVSKRMLLSVGLLMFLMLVSLVVGLSVVQSVSISPAVGENAVKVYNCSFNLSSSSSDTYYQLNWFKNGVLNKTGFVNLSKAVVFNGTSALNFTPLSKTHSEIIVLNLTGMDRVGDLTFKVKGFKDYGVREIGQLASVNTAERARGITYLNNNLYIGNWSSYCNPSVPHSGVTKLTMAGSVVSFWRDPSACPQVYSLKNNGTHIFSGADGSDVAIVVWSTAGSNVRNISIASYNGGFIMDEVNSTHILGGGHNTYDKDGTLVQSSSHTAFDFTYNGSRWYYTGASLTRRYLNDTTIRTWTDAWSSPRYGTATNGTHLFFISNSGTPSIVTYSDFYDYPSNINFDFGNDGVDDYINTSEQTETSLSVTLNSTGLSAINTYINNNCNASSCLVPVKITMKEAIGAFEVSSFATKYTYDADLRNETTVGDRWICSAIPTNGTHNGTAVNSSNLSILPYAPNIGVFLSLDNSTLNGALAFVDALRGNNYTNFTSGLNPRLLIFQNNVSHNESFTTWYNVTMNNTCGAVSFAFYSGNLSVTTSAGAGLMNLFQPAVGTACHSGNYTFAWQYTEGFFGRVYNQTNYMEIRWFAPSLLPSSYSNTIEKVFPNVSFSINLTQPISQYLGYTAYSTLNASCFNVTFTPPAVGFDAMTKEERKGFVVNINANTSCPNGVYYGNFTFNESFENHFVAFPVTIELTNSSPILAVSPLSWVENESITGVGEIKELNISNSGTGNGTDCNITSSGTLKVEHSSFNVLAGSYTLVNVIVTPLVAGNYIEYLDVSCMGIGSLRSHSEPDVEVTMVATDPVVPVVTTGGGGGTFLFVTKNLSIETIYGGDSYNLIQGASDKVVDFYLWNRATGNVSVTLKCSPITKGICNYVKLAETSVAVGAGNVPYMSNLTILKHNVSAGVKESFTIDMVFGETTLSSLKVSVTTYPSALDWFKKLFGIGYGIDLSKFKEGARRLPLPLLLFIGVFWGFSIVSIIKSKMSSPKKVFLGLVLLVLFTIVVLVMARLTCNSSWFYCAGVNG